MYANPRHLRDHEIKVRLDEDSYRLVRALADYNRRQPAVLVRELLLAGVERLLAQQQVAEKEVA